MATKLKDLKGVKVRYSLMRDKNISTSQAVLLCILKDIDISNNIPSNSELSSFMNVTKSAISRNLGELIKKGYLKGLIKYTDREAFMLLNKQNYKIGCLFCGFDEVTLDEHHFPIRAKDNGIQTISLCPNCHRQFHEITDYNRKLVLTEKTEGLLSE